LIITKPSSNHNLKVINTSHQLSAAKTCPTQQQQVNFNISNQSKADELKANSLSIPSWSVWRRPTPIEINQVFTASLLDVEKEDLAQKTPNTGSLNPVKGPWPQQCRELISLGKIQHTSGPAQKKNRKDEKSITLSQIDEQLAN